MTEDMNKYPEEGKYLKELFKQKEETPVKNKVEEVFKELISKGLIKDNSI